MSNNLVKRVELNLGNNNYDSHLLKLHDYFNIITLPIIIVNNWIQLIFGNIFEIDYLFYLFAGYIFIDMIWLLLKPRSVGSPKTILFHHIISFGGWMLPLYNSDVTLLTRLALLVEFNTWFNILKRYYKTDFIYNCFYITWFIFRVLLYPILMYMSTKKYIIYYFKYGIFNSVLPVLISCILLTTLNFIWSYELLTKKGYLGVSSKKN